MQPHTCAFMLLLLILQAPLYTSPHWVLSIACPMQHTEAGVEQGAFIALAQQPLQHVSTRRPVQHVQQTRFDCLAVETSRMRKVYTLLIFLLCMQLPSA